MQVHVYLYPSQVKNLIEAIELLPRERPVLLTVLSISMERLKHTHCLTLGYVYSERMSIYCLHKINNFYAYIVLDDSTA